MAPTRYSRKTLISGEKLVYAASIHNFSFFFPLLLLALSLCIFFSEYIVQHIPPLPEGKVAEILARVLGAIHNFIGSLPPSAQDLLYSANKTRWLVIAGILFVIGWMKLAWAVFRKVGTEQVVTSKKVLYKKGFIQVDETEMPLHHVEGVRVHQNMFDRMIGRGNILVNGIGMDQMEIKGISDPQRFRQHVYQAMDDYAAGSSASPRRGIGR